MSSLTHHQCGFVRDSGLELEGRITSYMCLYSLISPIYTIVIPCQRWLKLLLPIISLTLPVIILVAFLLLHLGFSFLSLHSVTTIIT